MPPKFAFPREKEEEEEEDQARLNLHKFRRDLAMRNPRLPQDSGGIRRGVFVSVDPGADGNVLKSTSNALLDRTFNHLSPEQPRLLKNIVDQHFELLSSWSQRQPFDKNRAAHYLRAGISFMNFAAIAHLRGDEAKRRKNRKFANKTTEDANLKARLGIVAEYKRQVQQDPTASLKDKEEAVNMHNQYALLYTLSCFPADFSRQSVAFKKVDDSMYYWLVQAFILRDPDLPFSALQILQTGAALERNKRAIARNNNQKRDRLNKNMKQGKNPGASDDEWEDENQQQQQQLGNDNDNNNDNNNNSTAKKKPLTKQEKVKFQLVREQKKLRATLESYNLYRPEEATVFFGNWVRKPGMRFGTQMQTSRKLILKMRQEGVRVHLTDEYRSSKLCSRCECVLSGAILLSALSKKKLLKLWRLAKLAELLKEIEQGEKEVKQQQQQQQQSQNQQQNQNQNQQKLDQQEEVENLSEKQLSDLVLKEVQENKALFSSIVNYSDLETSLLVFDFSGEEELDELYENEGAKGNDRVAGGEENQAEEGEETMRQEQESQQNQQQHEEIPQNQQQQKQHSPSQTNNNNNNNNNNNPNQRQQKRKQTFGDPAASNTKECLDQFRKELFDVSHKVQMCAHCTFCAQEYLQDKSVVVHFQRDPNAVINLEKFGLTCLKLRESGELVLRESIPMKDFQDHLPRQSQLYCTPPQDPISMSKDEFKKAFPPKQSGSNRKNNNNNNNNTSTSASASASPATSASGSSSSSQQQQQSSTPVQSTALHLQQFDWFAKRHLDFQKRNEANGVQQNLRQKWNLELKKFNYQDVIPQDGVIAKNTSFFSQKYPAENLRAAGLFKKGTDMVLSLAKEMVEKMVKTQKENERSRNQKRDEQNHQQEEEGERN